MTLDIQFKTMIAMVLAGFYVGISLETFRYFSALWYKRVVWRYLLEVLFWIVQTSILFFVLYSVNAGELRLYIFLALFLGLSIYKTLFAAFYKNSLIKIVVAVKRMLSFVWRIIHTLLVKPIQWIGLGIFAVIIFIVRIVMTPIVYLLKPVIKLVNKLVKKVQRYVPKSTLSILYKFSRFYDIIKSTLYKLVKYVTFQRR